MSGRRAIAVRAAAVSAAATLVLWAWLGWSMTEAGDDPPTIGAVASVLVMVGIPFAVAVAALAWHIAMVAYGRDGAARLLALATAGPSSAPPWVPYGVESPQGHGFASAR